MSSNHKSAVSRCPSPITRARVAITRLMFSTEFQNEWDTWDTGTQPVDRMSGGKGSARMLSQWARCEGELR
jgi:hypothetical protein